MKILEKIKRLFKKEKEINYKEMAETLKNAEVQDLKK